jgi:hypothetical protein
MAYRDFTIKKLTEELGLRFEEENMFEGKKIKPVTPSAFLQENMQRAKKIAVTTEKAISEHYISPILTEVKINNEEIIALFSGEQLNIDKSKGLNGEVDFMFTLSPKIKEIQAPIFSITEAKIGRLSKAFPQAISQMYGAYLFNILEKKELEIIYGAVTDGKTWQFIRLEKQVVYTDLETYYIDNLAMLLGILQHIVLLYIVKK